MLVISQRGIRFNKYFYGFFFFFFLVQKRENLNFRKLENQNINKDNVKFLINFFLLLEINVFSN